MHAALGLHVSPEVVEAAGVFNVIDADVGPRDRGEGAGAVGVVIREGLADVEVHRPEDAFGVLIAGAGAQARADVVERRHLVERPAREVEADVSGDGDVGVRVIDEVAGQRRGADDADLPRLEPDDLAAAAGRAVGAGDDAEGHRAVIVFAAADDDVADVDGLVGSAVGGRRQRRGIAGPLGVLPFGGVDRESRGAEDEAEGGAHAAGDHGEAFELERDVVGIMDDDDGIDGHAELIALADAGIDRRKTQDGGREDRARRPGARRRDLLGDASAVVIRIGEVGRGAQAGGHAVTALDGESLGGAATADERRVEGDAEASLGLEGRADRAVGEIVAVEVLRGGAAAAEELVEDGIDWSLEVV